MRTSKYGLGLAVAASCMAFGAASASAAKVQVLPGDVNSGGQWTTGDTRPGGTGVFETGPKVTPLGTGSFEMATTTASAKVQLQTTRYLGAALGSVDGIGYSTFRDPASTDLPGVVVPSLQLPVDMDGDLSNPGFTTLVYEPYLANGNASILTNTWQEWDAFATGKAEGGWYASNAAGQAATNCTPTVGGTCTLSQLQTKLPNAKLYSIGVNQGSGNAGAKTDVDALYVSQAGQGQTTFDFEQEAGPTGPAGTNGTNGAQGSSGTFTSAGVTVSTRRLVISSKSLKANTHRRVKVGVSCPKTNGLCEGRISLTRRGKTVARGLFVVRGGRSAKVALTVPKKVYEGLGKGKRVGVSVFSRDLAGAASTSSTKLTLKK
jgi:hypothetical protein